MQRFQMQDALSGLDRALDLAGFGQLRRQPGQDIDRLVLEAPRLLATPGLELLVVDVEPIQEVAHIELRGRFQLGPSRLGAKAPKRQRIHLESRRLERNIFAVARYHALLAVAERLAQAPDTGAQIVERGLVRGVAP